jgi:hypothetical protein
MKTESDAREAGGRRRAPGACVVVVAPLVTGPTPGLCRVDRDLWHPLPIVAA